VHVGGVSTAVYEQAGVIGAQIPNSRPDGPALVEVVNAAAGCRSQELVQVTVTAPPGGGGCGLLGAEALVVLALLRRKQRRA
jgi:MYXO-CTERM domain-containing protein